MENANWNSFSTSGFRFLPLDTYLISIKCLKMRLSSVPIIRPRTTSHDKNVIYFFVICFNFRQRLENMVKNGNSISIPLEWRSGASRGARQKKRRTFCVNCPLDGKHGTKASWYTRMHVESMFYLPRCKATSPNVSEMRKFPIQLIKITVCMFVSLLPTRCYRMHLGVKNASINLNSLEKWLVVTLRQ